MNSFLLWRYEGFLYFHVTTKPKLKCHLEDVDELNGVMVTVLHRVTLV